MPRCFSISIQSDTACAGVLLALDRAGLRDGPAVEQKFFCQCGFTGVRVRDDRKRPPPGDLFFLRQPNLFPPNRCLFGSV